LHSTGQTIRFLAVLGIDTKNEQQQPGPVHAAGVIVWYATGIHSPDPRHYADIVSGLIATLAPVAIVAAIYLIIFLILRRSQRRYYAPRTYLGSLRERYVLLLIRLEISLWIPHRNANARRS
jgi:hypothetical protein